jgi:hypothetical protein
MIFIFILRNELLGPVYHSMMQVKFICGQNLGAVSYRMHSKACIVGAVLQSMMMDRDVWTYHRRQHFGAAEA